MKFSYLVILIASGLLLSAAVENVDPSAASREITPGEHVDATTSEAKRTSPTDFEKSLLEILQKIADQQKAAYEVTGAAQTSWDSPSTLLNVGLLIVGACYTFFAWRQWTAIRDQGKIAAEGVLVNQIAAEAARVSASIAATSLKMMQRAYLDVSFEKPCAPTWGTTFVVEYIVRNSGPTRAYIKQVIIEHSKSERLPVYNAKSVPTGALATNAIVPGHGLRTFRVGVGLLTTEEVEALQNGGRKLTINGQIVYDDVFGERHFTRFCWVWDPAAFDKRGGFVFPAEARPEYNDAD